MPADDPNEERADDQGPPDPMDRLWRHPSEMGSAPAAPRPTATETQTTPAARPATWALTLGAGACGALMTVVLLAALGLIGTTDNDNRVADSPPSDDPASTRAVVDAVSSSLATLHITQADGTHTATAVCVGGGVMVTSAHAISGATKLTMTRVDGRSSLVEVIGIDPVTDLALLDTSSTLTDVAPTTDQLAVGDDVIAVGAPTNGAPWLSTGVVSALDTLATPVDGRTVGGLIDIDTDVTDAAVGGALINRNGDVVGILIGSSDGRGHAVPISTARRVATSLQTEGRVDHAWLGIGTVDDSGVRVALVTDGGPAAQAGIEAGDLITTYDGRPVDTTAALIAETMRRQPGDDVMLTIQHGDKVRSVTLTAGVRPPDAANPPIIDARVDLGG